MSVSIQAFRLGLRMEDSASSPSVISANVALFSQQQFQWSICRKKSHWGLKGPTPTEACALYGKIDHWGPEEFTQQRFVSIALSLHFRYIFVPQNMYLRTKDMHRHAKIGSILINKKQEKVNDRSFFNSALRAALGSVAFRKGPYRTNSGTTSVQTRLATRWHESVTFICTVTPRLRKLKSGSNKDALMWTGSCLVPVRRLRPQCISVTYSKQIRKEHLSQNAYAARNNED